MPLGLFFAVLLVVTWWPMPARWMTHAPSHHDGLFNMWRLAWITEALTTNPRTLFDAPIFHPATRVLAYSDAVLLQGLTALPWLAAGAPLLPVANVVFLLGPWASALGMYLLVRDLLGSSDAEGARARRSVGVVVPAVVAGVIFGMLPFRVEHAMHLELQWSQWMPFTCWALHRTVRRGRPIDGALTGVFILAQFLSCIYYGVFLVLTLAAAAPVLLLARERTTVPRMARALALGGLVCVVPLVAYSAPYRANQQVLGTRGADEIDAWSATAGSFVAAPPESRLYGWTAVNGRSEGRLWPGALAIVLAGVGAWTTRRRAVGWMYAILLAFSAVLALGSHTPVYRVVLTVVPMLAGLRAPARFGMVMAFALAALAGFGAAAVVVRARTTRGRLAVGGLLVLVLAAEYAADVGPLQRYAQRTPLYTQWLRAHPGGAVVDLPIARAHSLPLHEAEWSLYALGHGHPLANGYSGYYPRPYIALLVDMVFFPRGRSVEALRERDVRYIVMHDDRYLLPDLVEMVERMRGTPGLRFVGHFPDPDYPATLFEVVPRP